MVGTPAELTSQESSACGTLPWRSCRELQPVPTILLSPIIHGFGLVCFSKLARLCFHWDIRTHGRGISL